MKKIMIITISVVVVLAILFYFCNSNYSSSETDLPECSRDDIFIVLENYTCVPGEGGFFEFNIKNEGNNENHSIAFWVHNRTEAEFGFWPLMSNTASGDDFTYHYDFPIMDPDFYTFNKSVGEGLPIFNVVLLEIRAGLLNYGGNFECRSYFTERVNCSN